MGWIKALTLGVLVAAVAAGDVCAQQRKDVVVLLEKKGTRKITGRVLKETWEKVEVDRDDDGVADVSFETDRVRRIDYSVRPRYMVEAILLKREPQKFIDKLSRVYVDNSTPECIRQHAYYKVAATYTEMARADHEMLPEAVQAYEKLFNDIPDTRFAVTGRLELGSLLLELGKDDEAIRHFKLLSTGERFGPKAARQGKLMVARAELALKHYEEAERLLAELAADGELGEADLAREVKLLRSRCHVGQRQFEDAYQGVEQVLAEKPSKRILGMAYCVLGDLFAARGHHETALTAYLKTLLMYQEADTSEKVRAYRQAGLMLEKLGREEEAKTLRKRIED